MGAYLIDAAKTLSDEDAGGHGGRWGVIGDPAESDWRPTVGEFV